MVVTLFCLEIFDSLLALSFPASLLFVPSNACDCAYVHVLRGIAERRGGGGGEC